MKSFPAFLLVLACLNSNAATPKFRHVTVDDQVKIGYGIAIADVDGDKKDDIILADKDLIVWYQNPGWQKHVIAENLTQRDHVCIAAKDIDGDGKAEIAVGAEWNPGNTTDSGSVHYLIPPADRTQRWEPVRLQNEPTVHRMRWVRTAEGGYQLVVLPLHGRGNRNGEGAGVKILAYSMPADPKGEWKTTELDASLHMTHNLDPVQWDDDRAEEMLVAGKEGLFLLNRTNSGGELSPIKLADGQTESPGAGEVRLGKLPNGGRYIASIEPMHGNSAVVYTPAGNAAWNRHVIDESLVDGHAVACGDLLGAGYDQLVVGWRAMNRPQAKVGIRMFTAKNPAGKEWESFQIDEGQMACEDLRLADLNDDGKLDIIAAGRATNNLKIYFNEGTE